jgi:ferredoxin
MPRVTFMPGGQSFEVAAGTTILVSAIQNGLQLRHDCTEAICGTDRLRIVSGKDNLSDKTENEELTLEMMNGGADERLGCVARILGDVTVELPDYKPEDK